MPTVFIPEAMELVITGAWVLRLDFTMFTIVVGNLEQGVSQLDITREILMETGDRNGAMAAVQRIIEFNPPDVARYQQMLERLRAN